VLVVDMKFDLKLIKNKYAFHSSTSLILAFA